MKKLFRAIRNFFFAPADAKTIVRILPYFVVILLMFAGFLITNYFWEWTNTPGFCGTTCHTMPPQYISYQNSVHTNISCEDCHMGRDKLYVLIPRKIKYSWQTGSAMVFNTYKYPIIARTMAPANEACENCHKPEVFSGDKLVELKHYAEDSSNTLTSTFLVIKVGGGSQRQGLGYGIHWHVENQVEYYTTDELEQNIPYVKVTWTDGTVKEYIDVASGFDPATIQPGQLKQMDCITCHNRAAHMFDSPSRAMDDLLARGLVSTEIPEIKKKGVELLTVEYPSEEDALESIATLETFYRTLYADFYTKNTALVDAAILNIQNAWKRTNFPDQKITWKTHPNDLTHKEFPGCFRCHDGKHLTATKEAVRLECNLCHSIPVVASPNQITTSLELSKGFEPESHLNTNWITLHRDIFDASCQGCHTVEDPGGVSNTSFCSNSACHGTKWDFAGFDAPKLRDILQSQLPTPTPVVTSTPVTGLVTYVQVAPIIGSKCLSCHGTTGLEGLDMTTYASLMVGSQDGPVIVPGDPANSLFIKLQTDTKPHYGQFTPEELALVTQWILDGALEK
jgi:nitrate/TMAO reductase-like tetraheme cytochrome c subunit